MKKLLLLSFCAAFLVVVGSTVSAEGSEKGSKHGSMKGSDKGSQKGVLPAVVASAQIKGTEEGSYINGMVKLFELGGTGVKVMASISGVEPGKHGFHIHQYGSCANGGKAAGGHYNPHGTKHGYLPDDGNKQAHAGDMGNIVIDENGNGTLMIELPDVHLSDVAGRAIILHAKEDDFGQPTGNAGARIGCGTIIMTAE